VRRGALLVALGLALGAGAPAAVAQPRPLDGGELAAAAQSRPLDGGELAAAAQSRPPDGGELAAAAQPRATPRPSDGGELAYRVAEAPPHAGARVVVHYVPRGDDAPPPRDDDADGVPDYVEEVALAGDEALAAYANTLLLRAVPPDAGGPDPRPDLYVKQLSLPGRAFLAIGAEGGAFAAIRPDLERGVSGDARTSLRLTVAHELAHLVQFAYVPAGPPLWVAESLANAMAFAARTDTEQPGALGNIADRALNDAIASWTRQPGRSLFSERLTCRLCYGATHWWMTLFATQPLGFFWNRYLDRLAREAAAGRPIGDGLRALAHAVRRWFDGTTLPVLFWAFAVKSHHLFFPPATRVLRPRVGRVRRVTDVVQPLAAHYVRFDVPTHVGGLELAVADGRPAIGNMGLLWGPRDEIETQAEAGRKLGFAPTDVTREVAPVRAGVPHWRLRFRGSARRREITLVITGPLRRPARYAILYRALPAAPARRALAALASPRWRVRTSRPRLPGPVRRLAGEAGVLIDPAGRHHVVARIAGGAPDAVERQVRALEDRGVADGDEGYDRVRLGGRWGHVFLAPEAGGRELGAWWSAHRPPAALLDRARARGLRGHLASALFDTDAIFCEPRTPGDALPGLLPEPPDGIARRDTLQCLVATAVVTVSTMEPRPGVDLLVALRRQNRAFGRVSVLETECGPVDTAQVGDQTVATFWAGEGRRPRWGFVLASDDPVAVRALICPLVADAAAVAPQEGGP
jgi:hypothetical protein